MRHWWRFVINSCDRLRKIVNKSDVLWFRTHFTPPDQETDWAYSITTVPGSRDPHGPGVISGKSKNRQVNMKLDVVVLMLSSSTLLVRYLKGHSARKFTSNPRGIGHLSTPERAVWSSCARCTWNIQSLKLDFNIYNIPNNRHCFRQLWTWPIKWQNHWKSLEKKTS